jgi:hypothetical protein
MRQAAPVDPVRSGRDGGACTVAVGPTGRRRQVPMAVFSAIDDGKLGSPAVLPGPTGPATAVFAVLLATFLVLAIGNLAAPPNATVIKAGGWLGLVTAFLTWYHRAARVTNATWGRTLLPVFPWKK